MALMARRDFPLALPGLVHTENRITVHRELHSGERLDVGVHAERLREHPKGLLVDLVTEVTVEGERVWDGRSTYLRRTVPHAGDLPPAPSPRAAEPPPGPALPVGDPAAVWRLGEGLGRAYARVSGDVNPIHLHALTARPLGFRRAIAHGMWTTARTLAVLGPRTGARSASHAWFRRPVLLPSTVELVLDTAGPQTVAGLRSARDPAVEHLALTWA
jgi:acyl dehydratase